MRITVTIPDDLAAVLVQVGKDNGLDTVQDALRFVVGEYEEMLARRAWEESGAYADAMAHASDRHHESTYSEY